MDAYVNECITGKYDHVGDASFMATQIVLLLCMASVEKRVEAGEWNGTKKYCIALYDSALLIKSTKAFRALWNRHFIVPEKWALDQRRSRSCGIKRLVYYQEALCCDDCDKEGKRMTSMASQARSRPWAWI
jgi:hypothetical protein